MQFGIACAITIWRPRRVPSSESASPEVIRLLLARDKKEDREKHSGKNTSKRMKMPEDGTDETREEGGGERKKKTSARMHDDKLLE